jgi:hypothetical protein
MIHSSKNISRAGCAASRRHGIGQPDLSEHLCARYIGKPKGRKNGECQPHRVNQYLSATWSVVFVFLIVALLLQLKKGLTFHGVTTPFEGLATANLTAAAYNNDLHLADLREFMHQRGMPLHVITFDFPGPSTLSWHLSVAEKEALRGGFGAPAESYVENFPSHQQQAVRDTFQRNAAQLAALKKLMQ